MRYGIKDIPVEVQLGEIETRGVESGDVYARHIDLPAGVDFRPLLAGLPDDRCQCPHWGYVVEGAITIEYADGTQETTRAGDVYYWPAGHVGWTDQGVKFVEFSPTEQILPVLDHLSRQLTG
jgi:hypothetical protein